MWSRSPSPYHHHIQIWSVVSYLVWTLNKNGLTNKYAHQKTIKIYICFCNLHGPFVLLSLITLHCHHIFYSHFACLLVFTPIKSIHFTKRNKARSICCKKKAWSIQFASTSSSSPLLLLLFLSSPSAFWLWVLWRKVSPAACMLVSSQFAISAKPCCLAAAFYRAQWIYARFNLICMVILIRRATGRNRACTSRNKATGFHVMHQGGEEVACRRTRPGLLHQRPDACKHGDASPRSLSKMGMQKRQERSGVQKVYCTLERSVQGVAAASIFFPLLIHQPCCCGAKGEQSLQSPQIGARAKVCGNLLTWSEKSGGILLLANLSWIWIHTTTASIVWQDKILLLLHC